MEKEFEIRHKILEERVGEVKTEYQRELKVKDAIIANLEKRVNELKQEMRKSIQIMKVPRLMEAAAKRLNYDAIEITHIKPRQSPLPQGSLQNNENCRSFTES